MITSRFVIKLGLLLAVLLVGVALTVGLIQVARAASTNPVGWRQSNISGFGTVDNNNAQLAAFKGALYAGTWNDNKAQIWKTSDGMNWQQITTPNWISTTSIMDLEVFQGKLYFGADGKGGAQIWRSENGSAWEKVVDQGFGEPGNLFINCMDVFSDTLYAATNNDATGIQIWRSSNGDAGSWSKVHEFGADAPGDNGFTTMQVWDGRLYVGISRNNVAQLWRTPDGTTWKAILTSGMDDPNNLAVTAMAVYHDLLYIGERNTAQGGQVWRTSDANTWYRVVNNGEGNSANSRPYGLISGEHNLYLVFSNQSTGAEVWSSMDGAHWGQIATHGWGDGSNAYADYLDNGAAVFLGHLYIGVSNPNVGAEVWQRLNVIYLPLVKK